MLEVRHLRLIRALAEEGGPTRAAARLHLTQSAISHQLSDLEARLGVSLFTRVRRRLVLTRAGSRLLAFSNATLAQLARVEGELHRVDVAERVQLRVSIETFTSYHWLPELLSRLQRQHPHVDMRVVIEATQEPLAALLRGEIDCALVSAPVRDRQLAVVKLFDDEWIVALAPGHPLARKRIVGASDLSGHTLYVHRAPQRDVERLRDRIAAERSKMPQVQVVPLTEVIIGLVKAGLGIGLMSRWAVAPAERDGQIVARRFTRAGLREHWSLVYRRDCAHKPLMEHIAALLQASAAPKA